MIRIFNYSDSLDLLQAFASISRLKRAHSQQFAVTLAALLSSLPLTACDDADDSHRDDEVENAGGGNSLYAVMTQLSSADESLSYFKMVDAIEPQNVDLDSARVFTGLDDAWFWQGDVFIAEAEKQSITKFKVDGGKLIAGETLGLSDYGISSLGFWVITFISPTKAYVVNGTSEYIAWNPKTMEITGTVPMPDLEMRDGLRPFASYTDRSVAIRDGLFYHPFYYTNDDYFEYAPSSSIAVYDVETDELVKVIEAPCPGLDHVTQDEEIYDITQPTDANAVFTVDGWTLRLMKLR
jgi:hypothetical protein